MAGLFGFPGPPGWEPQGWYNDPVNPINSVLGNLGRGMGDIFSLWGAEQRQLNDALPFGIGKPFNLMGDAADYLYRAGQEQQWPPSGAPGGPGGPGGPPTVGSPGGVGGTRPPQRAVGRAGGPGQMAQSPAGRDYGSPMNPPDGTGSNRGQEGLDIRSDISNLPAAFAENMMLEGRNPYVGYANQKMMKYAKQSAPAIMAQFMKDPSLLDRPQDAISNVQGMIDRGENTMYNPAAGRGLANKMLEAYNRTASDPLTASAIDKFLSAQLGSKDGENPGADMAATLASLMYGGVGGQVGKFLQGNAVQEGANADFMWRNPQAFNLPNRPITYMDILSQGSRR